ncbi:MAG TPA: ABC transporter permease [Acidimicrobiales bacterium]|nr:ABC transporter permease [Acidimicrobiales bacterium]
MFLRMRKSNEVRSGSEGVQTHQTTESEESWIAAVVQENRNQRRTNRRIIWLERIGAVVLFLTGWQLLNSLGIVLPILISSPRLIGSDMVQLFQTGSFYTDALTTLLEMISGLIIGTIIGISVGLGIGMKRRLSRAVQPLAVAAHSIPAVILAPLVAVWFGFGFQPKIGIVALAVFYPIFFNTLTGASNIDETLVSNLKIFGLSRRSIVRHVYLPSAVVWTVASLRTAVSFALTGAIVAEFVGARHGLGVAMVDASQFLHTARVFSILLVLTTFGVVFGFLVRALENYMFRWQR